MLINEQLYRILTVDFHIPMPVLDNLANNVGSISELGVSLIKEGYIRRIDMGELIASVYNVTYVELNKIYVDINLMKEMPPEFSEGLNYIPLYELNGVNTISTSDIDFNKDHKEKAILFKKPCNFVFSFHDEIKRQLKFYYKSLDVILNTDYSKTLKRFNQSQSISAIELNKLLDDKEVIRINDALIHYALREQASDIHIQPYKNKTAVFFRIDGKLQNVINLPNELHNSLINRLKIVSNLDISENRLPLDGKFTFTIDSENIDIRFSSTPTINGEKVVLRILATDHLFDKPKLSDLGVTTYILNNIHAALSKCNGMLFVTGPTGSGKTTTLYAILDYLKNPSLNIVTIEDPVEVAIEGVTQIEVNQKVGLNFNNVLRSVLRQDPNIILVGEIRDLETAHIAATAALTGHTVLTTLHTNNALQAITRMLDMGVENFVVAPSIIGIINQRLVRMICENCKYAYQPTTSELAIFKRVEHPDAIQFYCGKGCESCKYTGYKGRIPIMEYVEITPRLRSGILRGVNYDEMVKIAYSEGYKDLFYDGILKVLQGYTTLSEVISVSSMAEF